jgi:type I restriction enzyme S subunit
MKVRELRSAEDNITPAALQGSTTNLIAADSVLVVTRSGILQRTVPVAVNRIPVTINQDIKALTPHAGVLAEFVASFIESREQTILADCAKSGTTVASIDTDKLTAFHLPLPPLPEQRRIVAKLDELRARSQKAREALAEVPALLEKLKQSVLASAFRGDLTAEWRAAQAPGSVEPASVLLERIRAERRAQWEQANPKKKYEEPEPVDTEGLPELPEGWCWSRVGDVFDVHVGATPSRKEPDYWGGTIPWVSSGEVAFCRISKTREGITEAGLRHTSTSLHPTGTVLIGMIGEGRTRGQVAVLDIPACNNQNSAAIRVANTGIPSEYVYRYLESQYESSRAMAAGNSQPALNKSRVQSMLIPLAPLPEARELVAKAEATFTAWSMTMEGVQATAANLISLDQAILAKAFRGELVPQDPNDEPAEALLARIQAEAAAPQAKRAGPGRPRRGGA